jgi:type IV secretory pathway TraG/TraD family ATPase VirD4
VLEIPEFDPLTLIYKNPTTRERFGPGELPPVLILGINPENQDVLGPFLGACIRRLMFILREEAQRCGGRLPHDFYLLLDEFAILMGHRGGWKDFEKDINDLRSQGVGIFAAHQVKDQLYSLWEKDIAEIIEDSFNTVVALAGCDDDTARWVEEMAGKSTVYKVNEMLSTSQNTLTNNFGMSSAYSESEAPLVPASTVQNPPRGAQATFLLPVEKPPRVPPGYNTLRRHVFHMRLDEVYADRGIARIAPELLLRRAQGLHGSLEEVAAGWGIPLTSRLAKGSAR